MIERWASRVDSRAQRSASPGSPRSQAAQHLRVLQRVHHRPAEGSEEVGHRAQVHQHHVAGDALGAGRLGPLPAGDDLGEGGGRRAVAPGIVGGARSRRAAASSAARAWRSSRRPAAPTPPSARGGRRQLRRRGGRAGSTSWSKRPDGAGVSPAHDARARRWARRRVNTNTSTTPSSPSSANDARRVASRAAEVPGHVIAAEQLVGQGAAADEQLVGQLRSQHLPVGDALAGVVLRAARRRLRSPSGEKRKRYAVSAAVDQEGVAVAVPGPGDRPDRVDHVGIPGEGAVRHRRKGLDRRRRHPGMPPDPPDRAWEHEDHGSLSGARGPCWRFFWWS